MDRRERLRRFLTSGATAVAAASVWAAVTALSELVGSAATRQSWIGAIAIAIAIVAPLIWLGVSFPGWRRRRAQWTEARAEVVTDPQLLDLLHELEIEQERFDEAMLEKPR